MKTQFSELLTLLMKEHKISGQKIADAVGKSQKTISRYANGEIDPPEEMKNKILNAISIIRGTENEEILTDFYDYYDDLGLELFDPDGVEMQIAREQEENDNQTIDFLINEFSKMTAHAKSYYLENFDHFMKVREWEMYVLDYFHSLDIKKQEDLLEYLEHFTITYDRISSPEKLSSYMHMISASENRPSVIIGKESYEEASFNHENEEFENKLSLLHNFLSPYDSPDYIPDGTSISHQSIVPTHEYLKYSPFDWYLLLRIQIFESYENAVNGVLWNDDYQVIIGPKLYGLLESYR